MIVRGQPGPIRTPASRYVDVLREDRQVEIALPVVISVEDGRGAILS
jgi:hypothetical protein